MTTALHLADTNDFAKLDPLVEAFHAEMQIPSDAETRAKGILPLLQGSPYGAAYILGPRLAPVGYVVVTFGWSVEFGGMDAFVDEVYIRPAVRGRGMATEALIGLAKALENVDVCALHLEVDRNDDKARKLYLRSGFQARERYMLMTRRLR
ncbi:acetyltransferase (GNAT) family protein [Shimia isoporae]|uniref:Acetyltransferase (GNAT) family protein n=1 Tax=Shimia isoporae TaxID=647720 RepID=A0A4R1NS54_9RHOB|nr:GNAT family N-acetyltransferase [Shimia isoporae]TCL09603.1 acetyltransferase (GNAT) family protein [Shimia isoporae]